MQIDLSAVNYLAVLVSAVSTFVVGGVWYSALFAKAWAKAADMTDEKMANGNQGAIFGGAFVLSVVVAFMLELFIGPEGTIGVGFLAGFFAAVGWVIPFLGIWYLFERRGFAHFAINGAYALVTLSVMGLILGAW